MYDLINVGDGDWMADAGGFKGRALDGGRDSPGVVAILWVVRLTEKHWQSVLRKFTQQKIHNGRLQCSRLAGVTLHCPAMKNLRCVYSSKFFDHLLFTSKLCYETNIEITSGRNLAVFTVHAFGYNLAESEPIWMKSGAL